MYKKDSIFQMMQPKMGCLTSLSYVPTLAWRDSKISGRHWLLSQIDIVMEIIKESGMPKNCQEIIKNQLGIFAYAYISGFPDQAGPFVPMSKIFSHENVDILGVDSLAILNTYQNISSALSIPDFPKEIDEFLVRFKKNCSDIMDYNESEYVNFIKDGFCELKNRDSDFCRLLVILVCDELKGNVQIRPFFSMLFHVCDNLDNNITYYLASQLICLKLNLPTTLSENQTHKKWKYRGANLIQTFMKSRLEQDKREKIFFLSQQNDSSENGNIGDKKYTCPTYSEFDYIDTNGCHKRLYFDNPYIEAHICLYNSVVVNFALLDELRTLLMTKMKNYLEDEKEPLNTFFSRLNPGFESNSGYNPDGSVGPDVNIPKLADDIEKYMTWINEQNEINKSISSLFVEIKELVQNIKELLLSIISEMKNMTKISIVGRPDGIAINHFSNIQDLRKKWVVFIGHAPISSLTNSKFEKNWNQNLKKQKQNATSDESTSDSNSDSDDETDRVGSNSKKNSGSTKVLRSDSNETAFETFTKEFSLKNGNKSTKNKNAETIYCQCHNYELTGKMLNERTATKTYVNKQKMINDPNRPKYAKYTDLEKKVMLDCKLLVVFGCQKYWLETDLHDPNKCHKCQITIWDSDREQKQKLLMAKNENHNWKGLSTIEKAKDYYSKYSHPYFVDTSESKSQTTNDISSSKPEIKLHQSLTSSQYPSANQQQYFRYDGNDLIGHLLSDCFPPFLQISHFERLYKYIQIIESNIEGYFSLHMSLSRTIEFEKNLIVNRFKKITSRLREDPGWNMNVEIFENIESSETIFDNKHSVHLIKNILSEQLEWSKKTLGYFKTSGDLSLELSSLIKLDGLKSDHFKKNGDKETDILESIKSMSFIINPKKIMLTKSSDYYPAISLNDENSCILTRLKIIKAQSDVMSTMIPAPLHDNFLNYLYQPNFPLVDDNILEYFKSNPKSPFFPRKEIDDRDYERKIGYSSPPILRLSFKDRVLNNFGLNFVENLDFITYKQFENDSKLNPESIEDFESNFIYSEAEIELEKYCYLWNFRQTYSKIMAELLFTRDSPEPPTDTSQQTRPNHKTTTDLSFDDPFKEPDTLTTNTSQKSYDMKYGIGMIYDSVAKVGSMIPKMYKNYQGNTENIGSSKSVGVTPNNEHLFEDDTFDIHDTSNDNLQNSKHDEDTQSNVINATSISLKTKNFEKSYPIDHNFDSEIENKNIPDKNFDASNLFLRSRVSSVDQTSISDQGDMTSAVTDNKNFGDCEKINALNNQGNINKQNEITKYISKDMITFYDIQKKFIQTTQNTSSNKVWDILSSDPLHFVKSHAHSLCYLSNFHASAFKISNIKTLINSSPNYIKSTFRSRYFQVIKSTGLSQSLISIFFKPPYFLFRNSDMFIAMTSRSVLSRITVGQPNDYQNETSIIVTTDDIVIDPIYDMLVSKNEIIKSIGHDTDKLLKSRDEMSNIVNQIKNSVLETKDQPVQNNNQLNIIGDFYNQQLLIIHKSLLYYHQKKRNYLKNKKVNYSFIVGVIKKE